MLSGYNVALLLKEFLVTDIRPSTRHVLLLPGELLVAVGELAALQDLVSEALPSYRALADEVAGGRGRLAEALATRVDELGVAINDAVATDSGFGAALARILDAPLAERISPFERLVHDEVLAGPSQLERSLAERVVAAPGAIRLARAGRRRLAGGALADPAFAQQVAKPAPRAVLVDTRFPVTVYLSAEAGHERVEAAVVALLATAGARITDAEDPVIGSWFRRLRAASPEVATMAAHAVEARLVHAQDATVTATMMQNLGPVLASLDGYAEATLRIGALLIVKLGDVLVVHQLTAAQQLVLDHRPELAALPRSVLPALGLPEPGDTPPAPDFQPSHSHRQFRRP